MSIKIRLTSNAREIVQSINQFPARMLRAIAGAMDIENEYTLRQVAKKKLSGPTSATTLSVRTNRLRGSMGRGAPDGIFEPAQIDGTRVFSAIGSNIRYAGPLEDGFDGDVQVPGHIRKNVRSQSYKFGGKRAVRRKVRGADIMVRPHTRHLTVHARHYLRSTIEARAAAYSERISNAITTAWQGGNQ